MRPERLMFIELYTLTDTFFRCRAYDFLKWVECYMGNYHAQLPMDVATRCSAICDIYSVDNSISWIFTWIHTKYCWIVLYYLFTRKQLVLIQVSGHWHSETSQLSYQVRYVFWCVQLYNYCTAYHSIVCMIAKWWSSRGEIYVCNVCCWAWWWKEKHTKQKQQKQQQTRGIFFYS